MAAPPRQQRFEAGFVYPAWLDAGGGIEAVRDHVSQWLRLHGTTLGAGFVFKVWLDAGGGVEAVRDHVSQWLRLHGTTLGAGFVFKAWLDADGDFSVIQFEAIQWLRQNRKRWDAVFLTKELCKLQELPTNAVEHILVWCQTFIDDEDAVWRVSRLGKHIVRQAALQRQETLELFVEVSETLVRRSLTSVSLANPQISLMITTICSHLVRIELYLNAMLNQRVEQLLVDLVRHPASFIAISKHIADAERPAIILRIRKLLRKRRLMAGADRDSLQRFFGWVHRWHRESLSKVHFLMADLKEEFPDLDVWGASHGGE